MISSTAKSTIAPAIAMALGLALAGNAYAQAQAQAQPASGAPGDQLQEVVVTATKRTTIVQETARASRRWGTRHH